MAGRPVRARRPRSWAARSASSSHRDREPLRVALVADGIGAVHGVTHTLDEIRERGVPGFEVEVIGTDANVDRRLSAVAEVDIPFYPGLKVGVPSLPAVVDALAEGRYDLLHVCSPGPAGAAALITARILGLPVAGSYHTELAAYAGLRTGDRALEARHAAGARRRSTASADAVLSPIAAVRRAAARARHRRPSGSAAGTAASTSPASRPTRRDRGARPGAINVLYAGRLTREKGVDLLADAFLAARARDPRLHLLLAGGGPEEDALRERLGDARDVPRLARGRRARRRLRVRGPVPVLLADRHVRPGDPRGAGVGAAGRRGRRRRAGRADRRRPQRRAVPAASAGARPLAGRLARSPASRRLSRGGLAAVAGRSWEAASAAWPRAGTARSPAGAPLPPGPRRRGSRERPRVGTPGPPRDGCEEEVSLAS